MIITTTAVISSAGAIRLVRKEARPKKGEIVATLVRDVPDSAFQPPALTLRATVAAPKPASNPVAVPDRRIDPSGEWTPERLRRLMALAGIEREDLARQVGVPTKTMIDWLNGGGQVGAATADKLAAIEAGTKGVTS